MSTAAPAAGGSSAPPADDTAASGAEPVVDGCEVIAGADACGACVCSECRSELDDCESVEGCPQILACVRANGCSGNDCYCGDASLTGCVSGEANGPCKDVVLAAPGGKAPTLLDPSAGPASQAALRVAGCADADDTCRDSCDLAE